MSPQVRIAASTRGLAEIDLYGWGSFAKAGDNTFIRYSATPPIKG